MKYSVILHQNDSLWTKKISEFLAENGFVVTIALTNQNISLLPEFYTSDAIIIEENENVEAGINEIRSLSEIPIIVLGEDSNEERKVLLFNLGADDYIVKPFAKGEFVARINRAANRYNTNKEKSVEGNYSVGDLMVDFKSENVYLKGERINLTPIEYKLLRVLCQRPGAVFSYEYLLKYLWGPYAPEDNKILRVNMTNLRRKLENNTKKPKYLKTENGIGFRIVALDEFFS